MIKKLLFMLCITLGSLQMLHSQEDSKRLYNAALDLYERGQADKAIDTLRPFFEAVLRPKTDKNTLANMYRLLALSHLVLKNNKQAEMYTKLLLETNPYYDKEQKLNNDFKRLRYFVDSLKWFVAPRLLVGLKLGINPTFVKVLGNENSLFDVQTQKKYTTVPTKAHAELFGEYFFRHNFSMTLGATFSQYQYSYRIENATLIEAFNSTQKVNYIEFPLDARYYIGKNTFRPYFHGGAFARFLASAVKTTENLTVNNNSVLEPFAWGVSAGAGLVYRKANLSFFADAGLMYSCRAITQKSKLFYFDGQTDSFMHKYYDLMDDITLHSFKISVGLAYALKYKVFK